ncbi:hypothetical protein BpHYR1_018176 [Brachionus plicatilis]|uniref:Uncharacterized protein n=1 Tax=Brachionus plicatilis TaxID=10195 RepID=A0A3M7SHZ5_BRAPC|nr:hypothetical protein BpHYR1_018176 [Brachionus plicatilis]
MLRPLSWYTEKFDWYHKIIKENSLYYDFLYYDIVPNRLVIQNRRRLKGIKLIQILDFEFWKQHSINNQRRYY